MINETFAKLFEGEMRLAVSGCEELSGKPFCEDMLSILNSIYRSKYKDVLVSVIKSISWNGLDRWISNTLAKTHLDRAESSLKLVS